MKFLSILVILQTFLYSFSIVTVDTLQFIPSLINLAKRQEELIYGVNKEKEENLSKMLSLMNRNQLIYYISMKNSAHPLGLKYIFSILDAWNVELEQWKNFSSLYSLLNQYKKSKSMINTLMKFVNYTLESNDEEDKKLIEKFNSLNEKYPFENKFLLLKNFKNNKNQIKELIRVVRDDKDQIYGELQSHISFFEDKDLVIKRLKKLNSEENFYEYLRLNNKNIKDVNSQIFIDFYIYDTMKLMEES